MSSLLDRISDRIVAEYHEATVVHGLGMTTDELKELTDRICREESEKERERLVQGGWLTNG